jgi:hypothetical protein
MPGVELDDAAARQVAPRDGAGDRDRLLPDLQGQRQVVLSAAVTPPHLRRWRRLTRCLADELLGELNGQSKAPAAFAHDQREQIAALAELVVVPRTSLGPGDHHRDRTLPAEPEIPLAGTGTSSAKRSTFKAA